MADIATTTTTDFSSEVRDESLDGAGENTKTNGNPKPKKRYVYTCTRIAPEARDIAHSWQEDVDELNPNAPEGEIAQNSVLLDEDGYQAYLSASNLHPDGLHEVVEAHADGWVEGVEYDENVADLILDPYPYEKAEAGTDAQVENIAIPAAEDTNYLRAQLSRSNASFNGKGVTIAVLDTGLGAPVAKTLRNIGVLKEARSFTGENAEGATNSHGSHVATTATPDGATLLHGAVLKDSGSGSSDGIIKAIYWAVDAGADIINMSLSGSSGLQQYETALKYARSKNALVFVAAGNMGLEGNPVRYPAACPSAIAVSAYDRTTDKKAPFSNYRDYVKLASSGVNVLGLLANGSLGRMSGTSMATPLCVFVAAALASAKKLFGNALLQALTSGARDTSAPATHEGSGVVSLSGASEKAGLPKAKPAPKPKPPKPKPPKTDKPKTDKPKTDKPKTDDPGDYQPDLPRVKRVELSTTKVKRAVVTTSGGDRGVFRSLDDFGDAVAKPKEEPKADLPKKIAPPEGPNRRTADPPEETDSFVKFGEVLKGIGFEGIPDLYVKERELPKDE